ncbi:alpha beta hydrolase fold family [Grosmannia clavigera kw1407]|uniref:Alpha beta hydrolase fold family n=1 Tax=Grosmannia clavigera (strain kw1407 / UAMH 11150) TaxID=655863 RepID=F0XDS4_GROCL|nr:alpha beta hydrolase fold family [Grosmannia clavigera kw1407]EFX04223.1 alpha beta hydrolase fold family [Grosmannia clavigera kw1407]
MSQSELTSHFHTTATGTRLHYLQCGSSEDRLLVCLHGLGGSSSTYTPLLPHLQTEPPGFNVVLVDFPGFGQSPLPPASAELSIHSHVSDIRDLITALSTTSSKQPVLFGHSLGGIVALHYAASYPDAVAGLALFGPGRSAAHLPSVRQRMLDLAAAVRSHGITSAADTAADQSNFPAASTGRTVKPEHREAVRQAVAASNPEGYARTCEAIVDLGHVDPDYGTITCPALFVVGDLDVISAPERIQALSPLLGGDSWVEVVRSGHQPILEDTESVAKAVGKLLEKAGGP